MFVLLKILVNEIVMTNIKFYLIAGNIKTNRTNDKICINKIK